MQQALLDLSASPALNLECIFAPRQMLRKAQHDAFVEGGGFRIIRPDLKQVSPSTASICPPAGNACFQRSRQLFHSAAQFSRVYRSKAQKQALPSCTKPGGITPQGNYFDF